jgi:hypothetical protein
MLAAGSKVETTSGTSASPYQLALLVGRLWSHVVNLTFTIYDTYQFTVGNISGSEYAVRMALNATALAMDALTLGGGPGAGLEVARGTLAAGKLAAAANKTRTVATAIDAGTHVCMGAGTGGGSNWFNDFMQNDPEDLPQFDTMAGGNKQHFNDMFAQVMAENGIERGSVLWEHLHRTVSGQGNKTISALRSAIADELGKVP